jgi:hypothetical protein
MAWQTDKNHFAVFFGHSFHHTFCHRISPLITISRRQERFPLVHPPLGNWTAGGPFKTPDSGLNSGMKILIFSLCLTRAEERRLEAEEANGTREEASPIKTHDSGDYVQQRHSESP